MEIGGAEGLAPTSHFKMLSTLVSSEQNPDDTLRAPCKEYQKCSKWELL